MTRGLEQLARSCWPTSRRSGGRRLSWLVILALCLQVVTAAWWPVPADAMARPAGDSIEVCTANGIIVLDHDQDSGPDQPPASHVRFCAYCLPLLHGAAALPTLAFSDLAPSPVAVAPANKLSAPRLTPAAPLRGAASPQAPPIS